MTQLIPFPALRPAPDRARDVASVPYDVLDTREARALADGNPDSFLHVVRPEISLKEGVSLYADEVYEAAPAALKRLQESGALIRDPDPALYLYRQIMGEHSQVGVVACNPVDEYDQDLIKKHEKTRPDKENDRTRHVTTMRAHAGPVFLTYRGRTEIDALVSGIISTEDPLYDFTAKDGVRHTVWKVSEPGPLQQEFQEVPLTYVADGHHRTASASRAREAMRSNNPGHTGTENYNRFLSVLFPADQLKILPYNRHVLDLNGHDEAGLLEKLSQVFVPLDSDTPSPKERGTFSVYLNGIWRQYRAQTTDLDQEDPVKRLDAAILQDRVLGPLLGIDDPRTSGRIAFIGGIRGTDELSQRVDALPGSVAFSLYSLGVDQLMDVADQNRVLPPKSTWFEPKLRSGLLVHTF